MAFTTEQIAAAKTAAGYKSAPTAADIANANTHGLEIFAQTYQKITGIPSPTTTAPAAIAPAAPGSTGATVPPTTTVAPPVSPAAPRTPSGSKATLYGPSGEREVVDNGSDRAAQLQGRGWTLKPADAQVKPKATLYGPNGEKRVVFTGSKEASSLQSQGYTLKPGGPITSSREIRTTQGQEQLDQAKADQDKQRELARLNIDAQIAETKQRLGGGAEAPKPPSMVEEFTKYREQYGIPALEQRVTDLDKSLADIDASFEQGNENVRNKLAPMEVLAGEARELSFQYQQKRDAVVRERTSYVNQLTNANNTIQTMIQLSDMDYDNAAAAYNAEYTKNYQALQLVNEQNDKEDAVARQSRLDAQANLNTISNWLVDSGKSWSQLGPGMQSSIQRMEQQAGLPQGTFAEFATAKPGSKILSTVEGYDSAGNGIVTFIYQGADGKPGMVQTVKTGTRRAPTGPGSADTIYDQLRDDWANGMPYEEAVKNYPEFKGSTIDKLYGKEGDDTPLFPDSPSSTTVLPTSTITQGEKKHWWEFWK